MNNSSQILNIGMMVLVIIVILSLALGLDNGKPVEFNKIEISGNLYQSSKQYFEFANLKQCIDDKLSVQIIRDRLEKHPYIKHAELTFEGEGLLNSKITEKQFKAILLNGSEHFYLTDKMEVLPVIGKIQWSDYPIVSNIKFNDKVKFNSSVKNNGALKTALTIIDAMKYLNPNMYSQISEVDLCDGKNIVLYFNNLKYPVMFGNSGGVEKVIYLNKLWKNISKKKLSNVINYIDLSFKEKVYLGITEEYLGDGNKRS